MSYQLKFNANLDPSNPFEKMCIDSGCATYQDVCDLNSEQYGELFVSAMEAGAISGIFDPRSIWNASDPDLMPLVFDYAHSG